MMLYKRCGHLSRRNLTLLAPAWPIPDEEAEREEVSELCREVARTGSMPAKTIGYIAMHVSDPRAAV